MPRADEVPRGFSFTRLVPPNALPAAPLHAAPLATAPVGDMEDGDEDVAADLRILSLLPSATEIVGVLGLTKNLVGVTHECDVCPDEAGVENALQAGVKRVTASAIDPHASSQAEIDAAVKQYIAAATAASDATSQPAPLYSVDAAMVKEVSPTAGAHTRSLPSST